MNYEDDKQVQNVTSLNDSVTNQLDNLGYDLVLTFILEISFMILIFLGNS